MSQVNITKGRTKVLEVQLSYDVSQDALTSEIRQGREPTSTLIATWSVGFKTDGVDGALVLTLDNSVTANIEQSIGYMDIKRSTGGEPINVFDHPLQVVFSYMPTA